MGAQEQELRHDPLLQDGQVLRVLPHGRRHRRIGVRTQVVHVISDTVSVISQIVTVFSERCHIISYQLYTVLFL